MKAIRLLGKVIFFVLIAQIQSSCSDIDDLIADKIEANIDPFKKDSELGILIKNLVSTTKNSTNEIVCVDFVYPFKILIYNANLDVIGERILVGDNDFSTFLEGLNPAQSISISYPISTTLQNGTIFTVNNNTELKISLKSCTNEDIINYYSGLFGGNGQSKCVWRVPFLENFNNKYATGIFDANTDGTITFIYDNQTYVGVWAFLFVNNEFQMSINLAGTSQVAQDWNISRKIIYSANQNNATIEIENGSTDIMLEQICEKSTSFQVGSIGPAGGLVFYDKGFYSDGWRYLESSTIDLGFVEWGCANTSIQSTFDLIGKGFYNSVKTANFHDNLVNYYSNPAVCNAANNGTVAAKTAVTYTVNNYKDWYLPSEKELEKMYVNLKLQNIGNFSNNKYWSSTENNANTVKVIDFSSGAVLTSGKIPFPNNINLRVIRNF